MEKNPLEDGLTDVNVSIDVGATQVKVQGKVHPDFRFFFKQPSLSHCSLCFLTRDPELLSRPSHKIFRKAVKLVLVVFFVSKAMLLSTSGLGL